MQKAKKGDTVLIRYVVRSSEGRVFGQVDEGDPQTVKLGNSAVFPEIETALEEMEVGTTQRISVLAKNAFGARRDDLLVRIPLSSIDPRDTPKPGMSLKASQPDGSTIQFVVIEVDEFSILADGNHPLAGEDLHFELTLLEIKAQT